MSGYIDLYQGFPSSSEIEKDVFENFGISLESG